MKDLILLIGQHRTEDTEELIILQIPMQEKYMKLSENLYDERIIVEESYNFVLVTVQLELI